MKIINIGNNSELIENVHDFIQIWKKEKDSISQFTSGSTGKPKEIILSKEKMIISAKNTSQFFKLEQCKTALLCISPQYIGGKMLIVRSIINDLDLYVTDVNSNPIKNLNIPIDFAAMVPLQVEKIIAENPEKLNLIKYLIIGGAAVSQELERKLKKFNVETYATFGMTETISHIALKNLKEENAPFRVIGNTSISVENDCLIINSKELGLKNLKTNDIIKYIDEKTFYWKGRADFTINSGGIKIQPEEVETSIHEYLSKHIKDVKNSSFIISKLPDARLGEKVIFIGEENLRAWELEKHLKNILSKYEFPKAFYYLPQLSKTASGKIDRLQTTTQIL